jgi:P2 family phage contractile tail tube protein
MKLPEVINNYNVYDEDSNKLIGISDEVTLPNIESKIATIAGAGLLGEYDAPVLGQFSAMESNIPFRMLYGDVFKLFKLNKVAKLTFRGSEQVMSDGELEHVGLKVSIRGRAKSLEPGKLKGGESMNSSIKLALHYIKITVNGKTKLLLDILNGKLEVDGKDMLSQISKNC